MGCAAVGAKAKKPKEKSVSNRKIPSGAYKFVFRKMTISHSLHTITGFIIYIIPKLNLIIASVDMRVKPYINNIEPFMHHPLFQAAGVIRFLHYQKDKDYLPFHSPIFFMKHDFLILILINDAPEYQNIAYEERIIGVLRTEYTSRKTEFDEWLYGLWTFFFEDVEEALVQFQEKKPECLRTIILNKPIPFAEEVAPFISEWNEQYNLATSNCQIYVRYFLKHMGKKYGENMTIVNHF